MKKYYGRTLKQILAFHKLKPANNEAARNIGTYVYNTFKGHKDFRKFAKVFEDGRKVNCYHIASIKVVTGITMNFVLRHPEMVKKVRPRIKKPA